MQNCSEVHLQSAEPAIILRSSPVNLQSSICSEARLQPGLQSKYVFLLDLSASNFGDWYSENVSGQNFYYWGPDLATDANGARFDAVQHFLDNCSGPQGNQFAVIGFSATAGIISGNGLSCDNIAFTGANEVKNHLQAFKNRQAQDESWYKRWLKPRYLTENAPDSLIHGVTSYTSASKCLEKLILDDLMKGGNLTDKYNVFFISDGIPEDKRNTGCNKSSMTKQQKEQCYLDSNLEAITMTRTAAISKAKALTIQGIFYGGDEITPVVLNAISVEGGTAGVKLLDSFENNQSALCDLVITQLAQEFKPDLYSIISLNTHRKKGRLVSDSDADGLSDEEEIELGYDPVNPRSQVEGILDGICARLGGVKECQKRRESIQCDPSRLDPLGLSDCDRKILKLDLLPGQFETGVDSDRDGMPDFIEIVKGTDPGMPDMLLDPDGDGLLNREEIMRGSDHQSPDTNLDSSLLNKVTTNFHLKSPVPKCEYGEWRLNIEHLQTFDTLAVSAWPESHSHLNHAANEQSFVIIYRLTPMNSSQSEVEYYYKFFKIKPTQEGINISYRSPVQSVLPDDFLYLGKVRQ